MCVGYTYINKTTPFIFSWGHLSVRTTYKMAKLRNPDSKTCNFKCPYKALFNSDIYDFKLIAKLLLDTLQKYKILKHLLVCPTVRARNSLI